MRLLFIGPPGAGKGTQARRVAVERGWLHIASGELLREAVRNATPLGVKAKSFMERGDLVPDDLMVAFIGDRVRQPDADDFILDGFPRTGHQASALDGVLEEAGRPLHLVLHLAVPDELIVERLSGRRVCPTCQRAYHLVTDPPADDERCDDDGAGLVVRKDDEPATVRHRLQVYHDSTEGLLRYYDDKGLCTTVDGVGSMEEVAERLDKAIEAAL